MATPSPVWTFVAALQPLISLWFTTPGGRKILTLHGISDGTCREGIPEQNKRKRFLPDDAVRALTQLLGDIISFIDHKLLIKHLEGLAPWNIRHDAWFVYGG